MKRTDYSDFVGVRLVKYFTPDELFGSEHEVDILEGLLYRKIKRELGWANGLICKFENISSKIVGDKIALEGTVTRCEVDC